MSRSLKIFSVIACFAVLSAGFVELQGQQKPKPAAKPAAAPPAVKSAVESAKPAAAASKSAPATGKDSKPAATPSTAAGESAEEIEIRQGAEAFVKAYNSHDAKSVAELFALKAEFTDEAGSLIKGREAIQEDFAMMFKDHPQCTIELEISSIRVLSPNIAVEEGIVRGLPGPDEAENASSYVAVHVKEAGQWRIASVSDYDAQVSEPTAHDRLEDLAWMLGDWIDESAHSALKSTCRWDDSGNYLLHEFAMHVAGTLSANGSMRIGWDPLSKQIKSWTFDADSGYSTALWSRAGDEWTLKSQGVNADGLTTSATSVFRFVDDDTMTWRSYDRVIGGEPTPDVAELVIKRHAPPPGE